MKKRYLLCMIMAFLLTLSACSGTDEAPATEPVTELVTEAVTEPKTEPETEPKHVCENTCDACGACFNGLCGEEACAVKCAGGHKEEPYSFPVDYITTSEVSVDTGTLVFDIGENVYVPGNLTEQAETLVAVLEKVSGLDFDGAENYSRAAFPDGKVHVKVSRDSVYAGNPVHASWYQGSQESEVGSAYASPWGHVELAPGDLFLGHSYALPHELGHMLMFRQSEWSHCMLLNEGFAEYTTYLALKELEQTAPQVAFQLDLSTYTIYNMQIFDYKKLYEQPLEYWFENTLQEALNGNYAVGFRFMAYLHEVYGDYSKWITAFEDTYDFRTTATVSNSDESSVDQQIKVLKATYGEDVLDGFYPWLKENQSRFSGVVHQSDLTDRTGIEGVSWYPAYDAVQSAAKLERIKYNDLYINIDALRTYIGTYKQEETSDLVLRTSLPVEVRLYQADGTYRTAMSNSEELMIVRGLKKTKGMALSLENVSYIKLVGEGSLYTIEVCGSFGDIGS